MNGVSNIHAAGSQAPANSPSPRLVNAAHEFEAALMKELLKPMNSSDGLTGSEDDSENGSTGALGEYASEALGKALSDRGGLGIADRIIHDLSHTSSLAHSNK